MTERDHHPLTEGEGSPSWGVAELAAALDSEAFAVHDVAHGDGTRFALSSDESRVLEIYPQANIARLDLPGARLELYRQGAPIVQPHGLRFDQDQDDQPLTVTITASGAVTLWLGPSQTAETAPEPPDSTPDGIDVHGEAQPRRHTDLGGAEIPDPDAIQPAPSTQADTENSPEGQEQPRVDLRGRVGHDPFVRRTPRGTLLARFPLAVREEGKEKPTWHQILSFGDRASRVQETISKGQKVTVIGYPHQREIPQKDGSVKLIEEIYAVVVKPTKPEGTQAGS